MEASMWGTWEELVLGGAVLRHGTAAWDAVAGELRSRSPFPDLFTPQECEAKYGDLQERYSGCDAWFEELRKQRVAELRRELEKSDDSIGSLQSKIESLNSERGSENSSDYNTCQTKSPLPTEKVAGLDSLNKEASRAESSAGSYMGDTRRDWSQEVQISASVSSQENDMEDLHENYRKDICALGSDIAQGICKKKRGQRKRKDCMSLEQRSVGVNNMVELDKQDPLLGRDQDVRAPPEDIGASCKDIRAPNGDYGGRVQCKYSSLDLGGIMDSIMEHKDVSIFRCRLESQKRARYNKMIRRHVDFQIISLRISDGSISSAKELFRDLLLLAINAIVFYPENTREHKSAIVLRRLATEVLGEHSRTHICGDDGCAVPVQEDSKPKKYQSLQACSRKMSGSGKEAGFPVSVDGKKKSVCHHEAPAESLARKRVVGGRAGKRGRVSGKKGQESPNKGRKRAKRR